MSSPHEQANDRGAAEAERANRDPEGHECRPKSKSLTVFHSHENILQSWEIATLFGFQDLNHFEDKRSLKLNF